MQLYPTPNYSWKMFYVGILRTTQKLSSICLSSKAEHCDKSDGNEINNYQVQNVSIVIHIVKVNYYDKLYC